MNMNILVTGGSGFIASHVVDALAAQGHSVSVLDLRPRQYSAPPPNSVFVPGSFADEATLGAALRDHAITHVVHAGWAIPKTPGDLAQDEQDNVLPTLRLIEACRKNAVRRVLFFSSAGVYGVPAQERVDETHATNPISTYGAAKLACEKYVQVARHLHGLEYVIARPSSIYGPGQDPNRRLGVINIFVNKALRGQPVTLRGDGSSLRDYLFISDAASAIAQMTLADEAANRVFNLGHPQGCTLQELVDEIAQALGRPVAITREPPAKFEIPRMALDATRLREALGWQPRVSLREGILRTARWLESLKSAG